jgi:hypothetical protein
MLLAFVAAGMNAWVRLIEIKPQFKASTASAPWSDRNRIEAAHIYIP